MIVTILLFTALVEPSESGFADQHYDNIDLKNCPISNIVSGFKKVQRKDLEDYIDPENGFLNRLGNHGIIDNHEIKKLKKITPYQSLNGELLRTIEMNIDSISKQFIEALCEDEQDHIAKFIVTAGCKTDSDERLLPRDLRKVIDDNMFCLEKLIDIEKRELLTKLVAANCIRSIHRDKVINFKQDEHKAYQLLIIIQRRRFKDFCNFMECLRKTMQTNIVKILEKGGVSEIKVQLLKKGRDKKNIGVDLIRKLTGYVDESNEGNISEKQKRVADDILAELKENGIHFIGTCTATKNSDPMSMFFQGETEDQIGLLKTGCESGTLKGKFEKLFRAVLNIPDSEPPLVEQVTTGKHSNKHQLDRETEHNPGEFIQKALFANNIVWIVMLCL